MLGHVTHDSLRPLIYPLVQVMLGVVHLQLSARHYPLRLHIVRSLLDLSEATSTFIPVAPYLLEVRVLVNGLRIFLKVHSIFCADF